MMVAYWDAGYVQLDVSDPANPALHHRHHFDEPTRSPGRPAGGQRPPGRVLARQPVPAGRRRGLRAVPRVVRDTSGPTAGRAATGSRATPSPASSLPDGMLNGPRVRRLRLRPGDDPGRAGRRRRPVTEDIALVERGGRAARRRRRACGFANKFDNAQAAGWDGRHVFNQVRPDDGPGEHAHRRGRHPRRRTCRRVRRDRRPTACSADGDPPPRRPAQPARTSRSGRSSTAGATRTSTTRRPSEELDAFAIPEARDARFATGFGDLSIHEFATDPTKNLGYSSYYAGGIRVLRFSRPTACEQVGAWIDDERLELLGRRAVHDPDGRAADRRLGSRLRARDPALHGPGGAAAAVARTSA